MWTDGLKDCLWKVAQETGIVRISCSNFNNFFSSNKIIGKKPKISQYLNDKMFDHGVFGGYVYVCQDFSK
jgi:hypothetical protein